MDEQELDLLSLIRIIRRRFWLILLVPTVAAVTAGLVSLYFLTPIYSASTTLWVIQEGSQLNYQDLLMSRNLTKTYAEVAKSRAVMLDVIENLGLKGISVGSLQEKLTVTPVRDTEIICFTIVDEHPETAARLADAVAEAFQGQIRSFMKVENVVVVDPALVPMSPIKPRPLMNVALSVVLGGMMALGLIFLLEYLDTSIKSPDDVTRHLGLPVLGLIPVIAPESGEVSSKRAKARERNARTAVGR